MVCNSQYSYLGVGRYNCKLSQQLVGQHKVTYKTRMLNKLRFIANRKKYYKNDALSVFHAIKKATYTAAVCILGGGAFFVWFISECGTAQLSLSLFVLVS